MSIGNLYANNYASYPYGYQYNNYMRQQMPQQPAMQQFVPPFRNVLFLSPADIEKRIVEANSAELLIDRENKIAYVKSADQMGIPSTKSYKFEELAENTTKEPKNDQISPNFDMSEYVKTSDMAEMVKNLEEKIKILEEKVGGTNE